MRARLLAYWAAWDHKDRLVVAGAVSGSVGFALALGLGAGLIFLSLVSFGLFGLHLLAETR